MTRFSEVRTLHRLAWLNIALHVAGLAFLAWGIRPGSILAGLSTRIEYLARFPWSWAWGWGVWMLCALALIAFFAALECHLPEPAGVARMAVILAAAGAAVDLFCDTVQMCVLPLVASSGVGAKTLFRAAERMANAGGLIVANGMYSVGVLL